MTKRKPDNIYKIFHSIRIKSMWNDPHFVIKSDAFTNALANYVTVGRAQVRESHEKMCIKLYVTCQLANASLARPPRRRHSMRLRKFYVII